MKKIAYYLIVLIVAGSATVSFWVYQKYFKKETVGLLKFEATLGRIDETVKSRGEVVAQKEYNLEFPFSGIVQKIVVSENQHIKAGDKLLQLNTTDLELQKKSLESQRTQARLAITVDCVAG